MWIRTPRKKSAPKSRELELAQQESAYVRRFLAESQEKSKEVEEMARQLADESLRNHFAEALRASMARQRRPD